MALLSIAVFIAGQPFWSSALPGETLSTEGVVIREAWTDKTHYRQVVRNGNVYAINVGEQTSVSLHRFSGVPKPAMTRIAAAPAAQYTLLDSMGPVDPASLGVGIRKSIPYTYEATPDLAFVYLETLIQDGWEMTAYFSDASFIDYYLQKDALRARILILENSLKVLYPIKGSHPDLWTFISD